MTRRWAALLLLLGISAWLAVFGDKTPTPIFTDTLKDVAPSPPSQAAVIVNPLPTQKTAASAPVTVLALEPRQKLLVSRSPKRDLFTSASWTPPPPPPLLAPMTPTAPPLPFIYIGKKFEAGQWEAYLGFGDQTFIVREGSIINDVYRVDVLTPPTLTLTYLPLDQAQTLPIGGAD